MRHRPSYHLEGGEIQLAPMEYIEPPKNDDQDFLDAMAKMIQLNMVSQQTVIQQLKKRGIAVDDKPKTLTVKDMTGEFAKNHWGVIALQNFDFKPEAIFLVTNYPSLPEFVREVRKTVKQKMGVVFSKDSEGNALSDKPLFVCLATREDGALFKLFFG